MSSNGCIDERGNDMSEGFEGVTIPRWEWRVFGRSFQKPSAIIQHHPCLRERQSTDLYILSEFSTVNCKIRDSVLDLKVLLKTSKDRLEQWASHRKILFPISINDIGELTELLRIQKLPARMNYDEGEFIRILRQCARLNLVKILKKRVEYLVNGVKVEIAGLTINADNFQTIGVEHEAQDKAWKVIRLLEIDGFENMNYVHFLKTVFLKKQGQVA
ncbi:MAG: hypothetical protein COT43_07425 [Candidatus Marinimicrobia bacterium CG08_land_8_20_14_0_20_45_22]|nr:MAG: hypothetical protein COT43_07425 [Candidatus Marinimicrobia bacterium CG08_land_8_20_14_0_20_45_22]